MNQIVKGEIIICLHCKQIIKISEQLKTFRNGKVAALHFLCPACKGKLKLTASYSVEIRIDKNE
jgi:uncharacterized protein YbaR (Trm112 family)